MPEIRAPFFSTSSAWDLVASGYAQHIAAHLALYAADALRLADVRQGESVLDVATGPGTLALLAARTARVEALDFAPEMLAQLRARADAEGLSGLQVREGDGQSLPYREASFDAAFSMFGLMMFPDRAKEFSELARVVRPGGRAVVSSWQPQDRMPLFGVLGQAIGPLLASVSSPPRARAPLSHREDLEREMSAAGFEVEISEVEHALEAPSLDALWEGLHRSHVGLRFLESSMDEAAFEALASSIRARLADDLGTGAQSIVMPAWLALGRVPEAR